MRVFHYGGFRIEVLKGFVGPGRPGTLNPKGGHADVVGLLLEAGADKDLTDRHGQTALMVASYRAARIWSFSCKESMTDCRIFARHSLPIGPIVVPYWGSYLEFIL